MHALVPSRPLKCMHAWRGCLLRPRVSWLGTPVIRDLNAPRSGVASLSARALSRPPLTPRNPFDVAPGEASGSPRKDLEYGSAANPADLCVRSRPVALPSVSCVSHALEPVAQVSRAESHFPFR